MHFDLDPKVPKVVIIAALLFIEAVCFPAYGIMQTGQLPTTIQWTTFVIGAVLQLVTFLVTFMKLEEKKESSETK